ncbi:hypothetical protein L3Y34_013481 [Caenorhabditis briggsae]|uniref:SUN domain-containing protein n=2 Tax=Caenorhabditis briggsae TaxID=6238 RepID=A0AAE8ZX22_CAEBR|nr:hypothetical protein L3Y34_013481 [Caenorhabditis briggsae]
MPDDFYDHEWKSEFASTRSGRNSPNIFAKVRRKLLLTPPVRNARSPRLTDEELDALTGDLPYATNYTYAYSKIYDPSLPDHWEVPNLTGGMSSGTLAEQEHWSAASLSRQLLYLLRFPLYLVLHVITYILEAIYQVVKISTYTIWDYILYLIRLARNRYASWQDNRRRTALIRNRQDPFNVKLARFIRGFFETIVYVIHTPVRLWKSRGNSVSQYDYTSIKDQLENERASRMVTRSQGLEKSRTFAGLSRSPARRATPVAATKTTNITRVITKVFANDESSSEAPATPTVVTTRTVRTRSVTPRFRSTRAAAATRSGIQRAAFDTPDLEVDTSLASFGLRSRAKNHLNTPEPTFDIGDVAATSTPLMPRTDYIVDTNEKGVIHNVLYYIGYFVFLPFIAARHIWYTIYDYGKSAYMKWTDYQPEAMEAIHVRDVNEPAPTDDNNASFIAVPWTTRISNAFSALFILIKDIFIYIGEAHEIVFEMFKGVFLETTSYIGGLFSGLSDAFIEKRNKGTLWPMLWTLWVLLLAIFLFGFLHSENTAIRKEGFIQEANEAKSTDGGLPTVPFWMGAVNNVKHYTWMTKEYVYDLAFNTYSFIKPVLGRTVTAPKYAWGLIASGCGTVADNFQSFRDYVSEKSYDVGYFLSYGFKESFANVGNSVLNGTFTYAEKFGQYTNDFFSNAFSGIYDFFAYFFSGLLNISTNTQTAIISGVKTVVYGISDFFYNYIYAPVAGFFSGNYQELLRPIWVALRWIYDIVVLGVTSIFDLATFLVTYPVGLITRGWIKISQYAPEDPVQVIPIPQAITPTPDIDRVQEQQPPEILKKKTEVEDEEEELKIIPAPAPEPIPIPTVVTTPPPVIIHQTNVVETVDKEAIIKEVTEKLRDELTAQFHQDLSAKFEQNYQTIIEQLKIVNNDVRYDNHQLEAIIRQLIYEYDTDKTGQVDYALESSGGAVISTRCSETYKSYTRLEKFWDIPIYYHHYSPRVVIQRNSKSLFPGECWCFKDGRGYIAVELSHFIDVSSISYEHIGKEVAPEGNRSSAPKGVLVWAYKQIDDLSTRVLIGDYTYDLDGPPLQFFMAKHKPDFPVKFVELEVTSNYGAQFTCLYRLRVHGKMLKV